MFKHGWPYQYLTLQHPFFSPLLYHNHGAVSSVLTLCILHFSSPRQLEHVKVAHWGVVYWPIDWLVAKCTTSFQWPLSSHQQNYTLTLWCRQGQSNPRIKAITRPLPSTDFHCVGLKYLYCSLEVKLASGVEAKTQQ